MNGGGPEELLAHGRVLVVEDDEQTAELMRRSLQRAGYRVEIADCVQAGLDALRKQHTEGFEALLLDYRLPDGKPWLVADAARTRVPEVPVIFVTGMGSEGVAIEAVRRGVTDYVKKTEGFFLELPAVLERVARMRRMKGRLDETSALMGAIVEHSSDLVLVADGEGKLVYLSHVCQALLGLQPKELLRRPWAELVAAEDREALEQLVAGAGETPPRVVTLRCCRKDGSLAWMETRVAAIHGGSAAQPMSVITLHDVTAQRVHEEQMQASLREKEVLLREIYHRVKNNLQVIQSLLKMRVRSLSEGEAREALESTVQRIHAMALVHERLYRMEDLSSLCLSGYLRDLFNGAEASSMARPGQIQLCLKAEEIPLSLELAVPFGLLVNELLFNSLKHAFPEGREGTITIDLRRAEGVVRLVIKDDGAGLPEGFNAEACPSMGLKLASSLAHQLGGKLRFSNDHGCRVEADLPRM